MTGAVSIAIALLGGLAAAGMCWYAVTAAGQITYVTLADGRRQERRLPLLFRLLLPLTPNLEPFFARPGFDRRRRRLRQRLSAAGFGGLLRPEELLSMKVLMLIVAGPLMLALLYSGAMLLSQTWRPPFWPAVLLILAATGVYPGWWLAAAVRRRHTDIEHQLPFVLDLMTLSVEAGLDFMTAIHRIIERRPLDALGEELVQVFREVQLGKTRREALRAMARRSDQADLRVLVNALVQADELGVSIGTILRIQADQMRTRRFQRAERLAHQAPVKLLFPLVAFIFPAVFIVLLGPVFMQILRHGF